MTAGDKPALLSIARADHWANLAIRIPVIFTVVLGIMVFAKYFAGGAYNYFSTEPGAVPSLVYLTAVSYATAVPLLIWRYRYYSNLFARGTYLKGEITEVFFRGKRGYIEFTFSYNGEEYSYFNSVFRKTYSFNKGDEVTVLIKEGNPEKAYIKSLYV